MTFEFEVWQWGVALLAAALVGVSKTGIPGIGILAVVLFATVFPARESAGLVLPLLICADVVAVTERDPACTSHLDPLLWFKGFHALQTHRAAHWLWRQGRQALAHYLQSRASEIFQVDIHPAARMGSGIFLDHGTGIVIGETAVVEDDVSMLHGVTLGGTGAERGDRHPKIGKGVLLGAGAKVLGNIKVGDYAKVASGSVVLKAVPPGCTAAGVPARLVNCPTCEEPARTMDHTLADVVYDYVI